MSWWGRLVRRAALDSQLDRELRFHIDQHAAELAAGGMEPEEARRLARLALGGEEQVKEQCRDARGTRWLEDAWQDLRHAVRMLRQRPAFAAVSILTLALGMGASTAIFSVVNRILFERLPYPHPSRIVTLWDHGEGGAHLETTFGTYRELAGRTHSFQFAAVMRACQPVLTGGPESQRLDGQCVSADYFRLLEVAPEMGRNFDTSDDRPGAPNVALISNGLWRRRFNSDPDIVGRHIALDDNPYVVIGVMPRGFENVLSPAAEIWTPLRYDPALPVDGREWGHHLRMAARLRPDAGMEQASRDLDFVAHHPVPEFRRPPWAALKQGITVTNLQDEVTHGIRPVLLAVFGAVLVVLAIACVNVTNLLLARCARRRDEFAMRAALGAGRFRLVRQLVAEGLLIAALGGALGMLAADAFAGTLLELSPAGLPRMTAIHLDSGVFLAALGMTTLVGVAVGLLPALQASRGGFRTGIQRIVGGQHVTRRVLVVAEIALTMVLLACAGLLLRSLRTLMAIAPGFQPAHILTMQVEASGHRYDAGAAPLRFFESVLDAVRRVPGVENAAFTSLLPLSGDLYGEYGVQFESRGPNDRQPAFRYAVTPGYFATMEIPLRRGRLLDAHDVAGAPAAVVVSESLARHMFPQGDAVGHRLFTNDTWFTVAGVAGDVKQTSLALSRPEAFYIAAAQGGRYPDRVMSLVVRTRGDAGALTAAVKHAIRSVDSDQPIARVALADDLVARSEAERRFALLVFESFALAALVLAGIGIYGVLASGVTERWREIGVRTALGASRAAILAMVVLQGFRMTAVGAAIGLAAAAIASKAVGNLLYGVSRLDPSTYAGVTILLLGVAVLACWIPGWRAACVDPSVALREE